MTTLMSHRVQHGLLLGMLMFTAAPVASQSQVGSSAARPGYDVDYIGPPLHDPVMQHAKETYVLFGCAYCHGITLIPRGEAADLMHSALVGVDVNGEAIVALLRAGVPRTSKLSPMPQFSDLSDRQLHDIALYIHYARQQGRLKEILEAKSEPGDAAAGEKYFDDSCASCHGHDLNGIGRKYAPPVLTEQLLRPKNLGGSPSFAVDALTDSKTTAARQRHNVLLENYTPAQVANLVAYLQKR